MASNELPRAQNKLWSLAADMSDGLDAYETSIGIKQNTKALLDSDLATAKGDQKAYDKAQQAETDATTARNIANSNGKAALALTKRQLADVPGALAQIWPGASLEIPDTLPERQTLVEKAADYLKDHAGEENDKKAFTEAALRAIYHALQKSRSDLNKAVGARVEAKTARDGSDSALRQRMSALIGELGGPKILPDDDDRWYAFGLVPPGGVARPGIAPDDVHLRKIGPSAASAGWSSTPRAHKYRPFYKVEGRDADFIELPLTGDLDVTIENLPVSGTLEFYVQATNPAGDSPKSEIVELALS